MLAIGTPELVIIFLVALMVLGPKAFSELIGSIGKGIRQFKQSLNADDEPEDSSESRERKDPSEEAKEDTGASRKEEDRSTEEDSEVQDTQGLSTKRMSLVEHLAELRKRLLFCVIAVVIGMGIAWMCYDPWILNLIKGPLDSLGDRGDNPFVLDNPLLRYLRSSAEESEELNLNLHFITPLEVFMVKLKVSLFAGLIIASPFVLWEIWKFVSIGLTKKERRGVMVFPPIALGFFLCGVLIAYFIMLPVILYFLVVVSGRGLVPTLILSKYTSLVVLFCLTFGVAFEMPLVILFLSKLGIVTPKFLKEKRKYAILLIFLSAAILTPPDVVTQVMVAVPMVLLYEVSIWLSRLAWRRRRRAQKD